MRIAKILLIVGLVYVGIVAAFELLLGYFQPAGASTMVITTFDEQGQSADRDVARLESDGELYVAANHWPRAWYYPALERDYVTITFNSATQGYRAVLHNGAEHERVDAQHSLPLSFRILTGFPPRYLMRLEPI